MSHPRFREIEGTLLFKAAETCPGDDFPVCRLMTVTVTSARHRVKRSLISRISSTSNRDKGLV